MTEHTASLRRQWLIGIEVVTGTMAAIGGALLIAQPDGRLLGAPTSVLAGSPFDTWLLPGVFLLTLVGGGYLATAAFFSLGSRYAAPLSVVAGVGLAIFEIFEVVWLGFQALEAVFMVVGIVVAVLALGLRTPPSGLPS